MSTPRGDTSPPRGTCAYVSGSRLRWIVGSTGNAHRRSVARPARTALPAAAIALAALGATLLLLKHGGVGPPESTATKTELDWLSGILAACSTLPIVGWRRAPRAVVALTASAVVVLSGLGYSIGLPPGPIVALYLWAASRDDPFTRGDAALVVGLFLANLAAAAIAQGGFPWSVLIHTGLGGAVAWFAGERTRLRRRQIAELKELARRKELEAERERQLIAAEERARIARDLHDSAGHAISVIAVRAGAARMRQRKDPERALAALEEIEALARNTVEEIDQIVGSLREEAPEDAAVDAPVGLASLDTLIANNRAGGLDVTLITSGEPASLGTAADQAAFRILQEALTNASRHGSGRARVEVAFGEKGVELSVTNSATGNGSARPGGGHGLVGMRERAALLGGSLDAGPEDNVFRVRARIPYGGQAQ